jgi:hypothetical protein
LTWSPEWYLVRSTEHKAPCYAVFSFSSFILFIIHFMLLVLYRCISVVKWTDSHQTRKVERTTFLKLNHVSGLLPWMARQIYVPLILRMSFVIIYCENVWYKKYAFTDFFTCILRYVMTNKILKLALLSLAYLRDVSTISTIEHSKHFKEFCLQALYQINLCYTHSNEASETLTNFRHVGELTYFHAGNLVSILCKESKSVCTESIIFWGSESGARFASRLPSRVSRAIYTIAVGMQEITCCL